jgi:hypothetical protein
MGHHCQAQMWDERKPLCLRCADGEPCYAATAEVLETPEWLKDGVEEEHCLRYSGPTQYTSHRVTIIPPQMGWQELSQIRRQLCCRDLDSVAREHRVEPCMIANIKPESEEARSARLGRVRVRDQQRPSRWYRYRVAKKSRQTVDLVIKGERIKMAPGATMGAEMIGHGTSCFMVAERVAAYYGATVEELKEVGKGHWDSGRRRLIAVAVIKYKTGMTYSSIADFFEIKSGYLSQALHRVDARPEFQIEVRKLCNSI